jgi:7-cyano-7-deazaguanine reductase
MSQAGASALVAIANPSPDRRYTVRCSTPELTCVCPVTGQPDYATVTIEYVPAALIVELKSLKLYLWSFRDRGMYHEAITNQIQEDLVACLAPHRLKVVTDWLVRGGIHTVVEVDYPG